MSLIFILDSFCCKGGMCLLQIATSGAVISKRTSCQSDAGKKGATAQVFALAARNSEWRSALPAVIFTVPGKYYPAS